MKIIQTRLLPFVIFSLLLSACSNKKGDSNEGVKVVLELSFGDYIKSLPTTEDSTLNMAVQQASMSTGSNEQFTDSFISAYSKKQSLLQLLDLFQHNEAVPLLHGPEDLKAFLLYDYKVHIKRMDAVLVNRINAFTEIPKESIRLKHNENQITVFVPGITDPHELDAVFNNRKGLRCWEIADMKEIGALIFKLKDTLLATTQQKHPTQSDTVTKKDASLSEIMNANNKKEKEEKKNDLFQLVMPAIDGSGTLMNTPYWGMANIKDTMAANALLNTPASKAIWAGRYKMLWGEFPSKEKDNEKFVGLYALKIPFDNKPLMEQKDIQAAKASYRSGNAEIHITFNAKGTAKWATATRSCVGKRIALEIDHFVYSAPTVIEAITGGQASITGNFTEKGINDFAKILNSGEFPLTFHISATGKYTNQ
jgi:SecD/SecF fusion protein